MTVRSLLRLCCPLLYVCVARCCTSVLPIVVRLCCPLLYVCVARCCTSVLPVVVRLCCPLLYVCVARCCTSVLPVVDALRWYFCTCIVITSYTDLEVSQFVFATGHTRSHFLLVPQNTIWVVTSDLINEEIQNCLGTRCGAVG